MDHCPSCGSPHFEGFSTIHHFCCAYVGPSYDFGRAKDLMRCPKCQEILQQEYEDYEIVGFCCRCESCGAEFVDEAFPN